MNSRILVCKTELQCDFSSTGILFEVIISMSLATVVIGILSADTSVVIVLVLQVKNATLNFGSESLTHPGSK